MIQTLENACSETERVTRPAARRESRPTKLRRYRCFAWLGVILISCLLQITLSTETDSTRTNAIPPPPSNRWLLIIQTSASMQPRADAVLRIVGSILTSGMNGQMRGGDTLGVWTYDETLHTGRFPLQQWTSGMSWQIAVRVDEFLKGQPCKKEGRLNVIFEDLNRVITNSDFITIILISDGRDKIQHTPFDDKINAVFQTWQKEQARTSLPFIAVLRARRGEITEYAVTVPPWPLDLPPLPPELRPAASTDTHAAPSSPPPLVQPLIVSGRTSQSPASPAAAETAGSNAPLESTSGAPRADSKIISSPGPRVTPTNAPLMPAPPALKAQGTSFFSTRTLWIGVLVLGAGGIGGVVVTLLLRSRNASRAKVNLQPGPPKS